VYRNVKGTGTEGAGMNDSCGVSEWGIMEMKKKKNPRRRRRTNLRSKGVHL
jgi:hypothetical protein